MVELKSIIKEDFVILDEDTSLSEVITQLQNFEKRAGLVFRKKKYLGLVEKRNLMRSSVDFSKIKVRGLVSKTPVLKESTSLLEAAKLAFDSGVDYLPVEKGKNIIGVIDSLDLAKSCLELPETKNLKVEDIKLVKPSKIEHEDSLGKALAIMQEESADHLPLFTGGKLSGVLSFRDVLRKYLNWSPSRDYSAKFNAKAQMKITDAELPKLSSLPISDFSTNENLITVHSSENLKKALEIMAVNRIHDVLVVDFENDFKGMLTARNVLKKVGALNSIQNYNIQFVGLKECKLKPYQRYALQELAQSEMAKLQRKLKQELAVNIHLKGHGMKEQGREKFSVTMRLSLPSHTIVSTHDDWEPETVLRSAFEHVEDEALRKIGKQLARDKKIL
ncbi:MAG: CBS domain-containing protein [Candidatus Woesearchaeota archaeon]